MFDGGANIKSIHIGKVVSVGKVQVNKVDDNQRNSDLRFNSDDMIIRCEIKGKNFDDNRPISQLPNCLPMLPRHINIVPKVGEAVLLFLLDGGDRSNEERLYLGPIISQPYDLFLEKMDTTALDGFGFTKNPPREYIGNITDADGVYPKPEHIAINGRDNADIIFKDSEVLLRAGKFVQSDPKKFNETNPSYIQIKHNFPLDNEEQKSTDIIGVTNIVSNKINLLTHKDGRPRYTLNDKDNMISDEELNKIIKEAHPLVFGDKLIEYLKLLRAALDNHVHAYHGKVMEDQDGQQQIEDWRKFDLDSLLSKNIKIN
jgi:hypothetical protein